MLHGGGDVSVVGRLDVVLVLVHHPVDVPPTLADVSLQAACQSHVRVCLHENLKQIWEVKESNQKTLKFTTRRAAKTKLRIFRRYTINRGNFVFIV
jgi:hypothetical protein